MGQGIEAVLFSRRSLIQASVLGGQLQSKPAHPPESFANVERQCRGWRLFADFVGGGHRGLGFQHGIFGHKSCRFGLYESWWRQELLTYLLKDSN